MRRALSTPAAPPPIALRPLSVSIHDATRMSGLSRSVLYELIARGSLATALVGRRRLVMVDSLEILLKNHIDRKLAA